MMLQAWDDVAAVLIHTASGFIGLPTAAASLISGRKSVSGRVLREALGLASDLYRDMQEHVSGSSMEERLQLGWTSFYYRNPSAVGIITHGA
jgi:hypothetical protein